MRWGYTGVTFNTNVLRVSLPESSFKSNLHKPYDFLITFQLV